jgi:large subunit ribosomal protein L32
MGALPKRKISKGRKNRRRANDALSKPKISKCPKCGNVKREHFACSYCGYYKAKKETKKTE